MEKTSRDDFKSRSSQFTSEQELEMQHIKKENLELISTVSELRSRVQSLQKQTENLQKSNTALQEQINKLISEEQETFNSKIQMMMEISESRKQITETGKENENLKKEIEDLEEEIKSLKTGIDEIKKKDVELEASFHKLQQQLTEKEVMIDRTNKEIGKFKRENAVFDTNLKRNLNFNDENRDVKRFKQPDTNRVLNFGSPLSERPNLDLQSLLESYKSELNLALKTIKNMKNDVKRLLG